MDRCYEVDIGDRMEMDTHGEGTVHGEVTNMLWRGGIGLRRPGAIEVKWNGDTGALRMGAREIGMWEQWRKVGEGQESEDKEMQPADVPATGNGTDARDREGRAGAPSALGGAQSKAGNTGGEPEAGQEVAGTQGSTKRSART